MLLQCADPLTVFDCSTDIERMLGYSEAEHVVESIVELPAVAKERERRSSATLL